MRLQGICFYRLVVDGRLTGYASIGPNDTPATWKLHKIYLLPDLHGAGLGSRLLQHCEVEARRFGAQRLMLAVNKRNARPIAAYRRNGFVVIKSVVTDFGDGFVMDDFIMVKEFKTGGK